MDTGFPSAAECRDGRLTTAPAVITINSIDSSPPNIELTGSTFDVGCSTSFVFTPSIVRCSDTCGAAPTASCSYTAANGASVTFNPLSSAPTTLSLATGANQVSCVCT